MSVEWVQTTAAAAKSLQPCLTLCDSYKTLFDAAETMISLQLGIFNYEEVMEGRGSEDGMDTTINTKPL